MMSAIPNKSDHQATLKIDFFNIAVALATCASMKS